VSTFYLLPPRPLVAERLTDYLRTLFPGLDLAWMKSIDLTEFLAAAAGDQPDVYVVYREDLPDGEDTALALRSGFGAELGDDLVEVRPGAKPGELTARRWRVEGK
jgi:hypothetical protein